MKTKTLFLIRGLSGSGKSSFARHIWNNYAIFEADKFFCDEEGNYNFDLSKLDEAHKWLYKEVEEAMCDSEEYFEIVITGTLSTDEDVDRYRALADKYGFMVVSLIVENRHGGKNVHDVPQEVIDEMRTIFSVKL